MSKTIEQLLETLRVSGAHDVTLRTLRRSLLSSEQAALLGAKPEARYIASSASAEIAVDFVEGMLLVSKGARLGGSVFDGIMRGR